MKTFLSLIFLVGSLSASVEITSQSQREFCYNLIEYHANEYFVLLKHAKEIIHDTKDPNLLNKEEMDIIYQKELFHKRSVAFLFDMIINEKL